MSTVSEIVKTSKVSTLLYYRDSQLWYRTDNGFTFPVPVDEVGNATFYAEEKSILLMRYIRKWVAKLEADGVPIETMLTPNWALVSVKDYWE